MRVDISEVGRQRVTGELGDGPGELDAGRTGTDDNEGQQCSSLLWVGLAFRNLEGKHNPPTNVVASSIVFSPGANGSHRC